MQAIERDYGAVIELNVPKVWLHQTLFKTL
jgi:hypothetical protein